MGRGRQRDNQINKQAAGSQTHLCHGDLRHRNRRDGLCCMSDPSQFDYTAHAQIYGSCTDSCSCYFGNKLLLGLFFLVFFCRCQT